MCWNVNVLFYSIKVQPSEKKALNMVGLNQILIISLTNYVTFKFLFFFNCQAMIVIVSTFGGFLEYYLKHFKYYLTYN